MLDGMVKGVLVSGVLMTGVCHAAAPQLGFADSYNLGDQPGSLIAADLNGDGKADAAAVSYSAGTVSIALNNGDGSFGSATTYAVGAHPFVVIAADVDGDGDQDLVVGCWGSASDPTVQILKNDGHGQFSTAVSYAVAADLSALALMDVDGANGVDLITGHGSDWLGNGSIGVLTNNGDGSFGSESTKDAGAGTVNALALVDLDGDAQKDLLILGMNSFGDANRWMKYDPVTKSFGDAANFGMYYGGFASVPLCAAVGDLNGDGTADLVIGNNNGTISTLLSQKGGFQQTDYNSPTYAVVGDSCPLSIVDVNADGVPDLLTPMMFMTNDGSGALTITFDPNIDKDPPNIKNETQTVAADIDGDSDLDVLSINGTTHTLTVRRNLARFAPDAFAFTAVTGAQPGALVASNTVVITGPGAVASMTIAGGEFRVNNGAWGAGTATLAAGDAVQVRVVASSRAGGRASAIVTVSGVQRSFDVTTASSGGGGGGGGGLGLDLLGALALGALARRRDSRVA